MGYVIQTPAAPRFPGEFELIWSGQDAEPPEGARYVEVLRQVMDRMKSQFDRDPTEEGEAFRSLLTARLKAHEDTLGELHREAKEYIAGSVAAERAALNAPIRLGRHNLQVERLSGNLFNCALVLDGQQYAVDLDISITKGLPPPLDKPSLAQQALFADIAAALTIVKAVHETTIDRFARAGEKDDARGERESHRARLRQDKLIRDLNGIADVGLTDGFVDMATLTLASRKAEFVAMEAPRIKNGYVLNLGRWSAAFSLLALVVSWMAAQAGNELQWMPAAFGGIYPFAIASIGAAIGTWLSFSIRRVGLTFEQLAVPEEDMLHPAFRVLFVLGLTLVVMLIFFTGVMNVEIGALKTTLLNSRNGQTEAISLLIGMFCGIAERGLSSAVALRAIDFVSSIGGAKRS